MIIEEDAADGLSDENVGHGETYTLGCIFKVGDDVRQVLNWVCSGRLLITSVIYVILNDKTVPSFVFNFKFDIYITKQILN